MVQEPRQPCSGLPAQPVPQGWQGNLKSRSCNCSWGDWQHVVPSGKTLLWGNSFLTGICSCSQDGSMLPLADSVGLTFSLLSQDSSVCLKSRVTLLPLLPSVHQKLQAVAQAWRVSPPP